LYQGYSKGIQILLPSLSIAGFYTNLYMEPDFLFLTGEVTFTRNEVNNLYNSDEWALVNPHAARHSSLQQRFSTNTWAEIIDGCLNGSYIMANHLDGMKFADFLLC
jgi:hypothetical protein